MTRLGGRDVLQRLRARVVQRAGGRDPVADRLGLLGRRRSRAGRSRASSGSRSRARMNGSVTVPSSRSVPRCLPVRSGGPGDVEHVVEDLEGQADAAAELAQRAGVDRAVALQRAEDARSLEQPRGLQLAAAQVALQRDRRVPRVGALQQLAARQRASPRRSARGPARASRCAPSSAKARANSRSPVAVAAARPAVAKTVGTPRRSGARSRTSSWTSVAEWTSSTAVAARTRPSPVAVRIPARGEDHQQRAQALAARGDRRARVLGEHRRRGRRRPRAAGVLDAAEQRQDVRAAGVDDLGDRSGVAAHAGASRCST